MAKGIKGITIEIGGNTAPLEKALEQVNKKSRDLQSELTAVNRLLKLDPKNTELLAQKQKLLSESISTTKGKLTDLKSAEKQVQEQFKRGEVSEEQYRALQREIVSTETKLKGLEKATHKTNISLSKIADVGKKMKSTGRAITTSVTLPILAIGAAAVKAGMDFEAAMSRVQAISGANAEEFKELNSLAVKLGEETAFSASQAAEGMENLASAGFNIKEIMAAMPGMLDLAASGGIDIASASEIAASALRGFGLEAKKSGHFADVLAKAAADTNAGVIDMGEALNYAAPPAHALGWEAEETAAAIGIMSDAGIKGEKAGTTLRSALVSLAKPTAKSADAMKSLGFEAFDAKGKMLPAVEVIERLKTTTSGLTEQQRANKLATIFGKEALSGMLAIVDAGPDKLKLLTKSFKSSDGAAKAMAETMQDNTKASIEQMMGSLESAAIKIAKAVSPTITKLAKSIQELANNFSKLNPKTQEMIIKGALLVAAIGPLIMVIGTLASSLSALAASPLAMTIAGVVGLAAALGALALSINYACNWIDTLESTNEEWRKSTEDVTQSYLDSKKACEDSTAAIKANGDVAKSLADKLYDLADKEKKTNAQKRTMKSLINQLNSVMPGLNLKYDEHADKVSKSAKATREFIDAKIKELKTKAAEERLIQLYKEKIDLQGKVKAGINLVQTAQLAYNVEASKGADTDQAVLRILKLNLRDAKAGLTNLTGTLKANGAETGKLTKSIGGYAEKTDKATQRIINNASKAAEGVDSNLGKVTSKLNNYKAPNIKGPKMIWDKIKLPTFSFNVPKATGNIKDDAAFLQTQVSWHDKGGIFNSPTIIGVGEKRPEFVGALDDLKNIMRSVITERSDAVVVNFNGSYNFPNKGTVDYFMSQVGQEIRRRRK